MRGMRLLLIASGLLSILGLAMPVLAQSHAHESTENGEREAAPILINPRLPTIPRNAHSGHTLDYMPTQTVNLPTRLRVKAVESSAQSKSTATGIATRPTLRVKLNHIVIKNDRSISLKVMTLTSRVGDSNITIITKDLAPGGKSISRVPQIAGCKFSISGEFEDGSLLEDGTVEICKNQALNLVE